MWLDTEDPKLGPRSSAMADSALIEDSLYVSAMSFWEVAMLVSKGRISVPPNVSYWRLGLLGSGVREVPVDGEIGVAATGLQDLPGDPADRIILATALLNGATLITADRQLLAWTGSMKRHDARV